MSHHNCLRTKSSFKAKSSLGACTVLDLAATCKQNLTSSIYPLYITKSVICVLPVTGLTYKRSFGPCVVNESGSW